MRGDVASNDMVISAHTSSSIRIANGIEPKSLIMLRMSGTFEFVYIGPTDTAGPSVSILRRYADGYLLAGHVPRFDLGTDGGTSELEALGPDLVGDVIPPGLK